MSPHGSTSASDRSGVKNWYSGAAPDEMPCALLFGVAISCVVHPWVPRVERSCCCSGLRLPSGSSTIDPSAT